MSNNPNSQEQDDIIRAGRLRANPLSWATIAQQIYRQTGIRRTNGALTGRWFGIRPSESDWPEGVPLPARPWSTDELEALREAALYSSNPEHPPAKELQEALAKKGIEKSAGALQAMWRKHFSKRRNAGPSTSDKDSEEEDEEDEDEEEGNGERAPVVGVKRPRGSSEGATSERKHKRRATTPPHETSPGFAPDAEYAAETSSPADIKPSTDVKIDGSSSLSKLLQKPPESFTSATLLNVLLSFDTLSKEHKSYYAQKGSDLSHTLTQKYLIPEATFQELQHFPELVKSEITKLEDEARRHKEIMGKAVIESVRRWMKE